jgi:molecular chaperone DnaJ
MDFEGILDHYAVLGLEQGCSAAEVRKAFRAKALKWHPDKAGSSAEARRRFQEATDAYEAGILVG